MGPSKPDVKGRLSGRTFWDVVHENLNERHPRIYIIIIILLIILLSALAAYLFLDIARHSSLPPFSKGLSQGLLSGGCNFGIPYNDRLHNTTTSQEMALSQNSTVSQEIIPSLNRTCSQETIPSLNSTCSQETIPSLNSTCSQEMIPPQDIDTSPNSSIKSLSSLTLQGSAAVLAAVTGSLANATVQVSRSLSPEGMISRISALTTAFQETLWQWPSSINSWASPSLTPLLKSLGDSARGIEDHASGGHLPRVNFSFKFPSIIAH
jgi:hypothetical protein